MSDENYTGTIRRNIRLFSETSRQITYSNLHVINAFIYIAENGCKWRALPEKFGNWHTIYYRVSRRAKNGVLDTAFAKLQAKQIVRIKIDVISMDSTSVKIHPDAAGALKKTDHSPSDSREVGETPKFIWLPRVIG